MVDVSSHRSSFFFWHRCQEYYSNKNFFPHKVYKFKSLFVLLNLTINFVQTYINTLNAITINYFLIQPIIILGLNLTLCSLNHVLPPYFKRFKILWKRISTKVSIDWIHLDTVFRYIQKKKRERDYYPRRIFKASEKSSRSFNERQREKYDRICPVGLSRKQASKKFTEKASRTPFAGRLSVEKKNSNYWRNG